MNKMGCQLYKSAFAALCVILICITVKTVADPLERVRRAPRVKRVIGGHDVMEGAWPWLAHLTGKIPSKFFWGIPVAYKTYYCGGSILNKRWILTAAHCFATPGAPIRVKTPKYWHIKTGEVDRTHNIFDNFKDWLCKIGARDDCQLWYEHAEKIVIHPQYNGGAGALWKNDIALVKIDKDLPVSGTNENIGTTTLADSGDIAWPPSGTECIMKGWGCTSNGGPVHDTAQQVELPAQPSRVCDRLFGDISDTRVCAGKTLQNKGICAGDSGGPLVCRTDNSWVQVGIASFTSANNPGDVPGVFTRVAYYRDWIDRVIREN